MKLTILGSGDCSGTPQLGCSCRICKLARKIGHPYSRTRFSILIETELEEKNNGTKNILIDTSPDLRFQLLSAGVEQIDAVFFTHADYDHTSGIFEFYRTHNNNMFRRREPVKIFSGKDILYHIITKEHLTRVLNLELNEIEPYDVVELYGLKFQSFKVIHKNRKKVKCRGYKITTRENKNVIISGDLGLEIPERTLKIWKTPSPDLLILEMFTNKNVTFLKEKHLKLSEALSLIKEIKPKRTVFVHISHFLSRKVETINKQLKMIDPNIELSHDGMTFQF
ncbi:MAG: MBL fold metallo-hydrolase [Candidatus Helarchaeota archaeon]